MFECFLRAIGEGRYLIKQFCVVSTGVFYDRLIEERFSAIALQGQTGAIVPLHDLGHLVLAQVYNNAFIPFALGIPSFSIL